MKLRVGLVQQPAVENYISGTITTVTNDVEKPRNTAFVIDNNGKTLIEYDKVCYPFIRQDL